MNRFTCWLLDFDIFNSSLLQPCLFKWELLLICDMLHDIFGLCWIGLGSINVGTQFLSASSYPILHTLFPPFCGISATDNIHVVLVNFLQICRFWIHKDEIFEYLAKGKKNNKVQFKDPIVLLQKLAGVNWLWPSYILYSFQTVWNVTLVQYYQLKHGFHENIRDIQFAKIGLLCQPVGLGDRFQHYSDSCTNCICRMSATCSFM